MHFIFLLTLIWDRIFINNNLSNFVIEKKKKKIKRVNFVKC